MFFHTNRIFFLQPVFVSKAVDVFNETFVTFSPATDRSEHAWNNLPRKINGAWWKVKLNLKGGTRIFHFQSVDNSTKAGLCESRITGGARVSPPALILHIPSNLTLIAWPQLSTLPWQRFISWADPLRLRGPPTMRCLFTLIQSSQSCTSPRLHVLQPRRVRGARCHACKTQRRESIPRRAGQDQYRNITHSWKNVTKNHFNHLNQFIYPLSQYNQSLYPIWLSITSPSLLSVPV